MSIDIRPITEQDLGQLEDFLYLAIHQPDPHNLIPRSVLLDPTIAAYLEGWGKPDDLGLVAVEAEKLVGAVWTRIITGEIRGHGNVDTETPEFIISVLPEARGKGIGATLMVQMLDILRKRGYQQASLSVQKSNQAVHLYERLGFLRVEDHGDDLVMVYPLVSATAEKQGALER